MLCRGAGITDTFAVWSAFICVLGYELGSSHLQTMCFYPLLTISWGRDFSLLSLSGIILLLLGELPLLFN